jgi:uncharacterized repeat protein (TIGR03803 family)
VAYTGGANSQGVIYRVSSTGDFKVLVNFNYSNGSQPMGPLVQADDGNFYGVTYTGGSSSAGVLFRMAPGGQLTVLHNFTNKVDGGYDRTGTFTVSIRLAAQAAMAFSGAQRWPES